MNSPLVSVIIPLYHAEVFIERTLEAVFSQTYQNLEVICVDNNSKDNSVKIVETLKLRNNWQILLLSEPIQGAPFARNLGLAYSNGSLVQFLDSDDYLTANKIKKQVDYFAHNADVDFITADYFDVSNGELKHTKRNFIDSWQGLITGSIGITSSALFKKDKLIEVGGFNTLLKSNQEKDLYFRLLKSGGKHRQISEALFIKNSHPDSISNQVNKLSHLKTKLQFLRDIKAYVDSNFVDSEYQLVLNTNYFNIFMNICRLTPIKNAYSLYIFIKGFSNFDLWNSNLSYSNRVTVKVLTPMGYYFFYKCLILLRLK